MSLTKQFVLSKLCFRNAGVLFPTIRNASHWYKDYVPGKYPKTPEERNAVAKKYEVLPSEYEPYPDDGRGVGDYPKLPLISGDSKDPMYPWDNPELKRNFNEPFHIDANMYGEDRYDISMRLRVGLRKMFLQTFLVMGAFAACLYMGQFYKCFHALAEKQYPRPGEKHYTFETE